MIVHRLTYLAHPLGGGDDRADNIARAKRWFDFLVRHRVQGALIAPWILYAEHLDESWRDRGVGDDLAVLVKCDAIVLVGGRVSPGMKVERDVASALGLLVFDWTDLGDEPPWPQTGER